jgi:Tol biopolymer transport system component
VPATGQVLPTAAGPTPSQPLADVNSPQDDVDPSFSADFCDLYFSSNRDGRFALYRAHRR